jgi:cytochrome c oxidase subunit 2
MRKATLGTLAALLLIAPSAMAAFGLPDAVNDRMQTIESIYLQLLGIGTLVFLVVFGWLGYNLVKYRPGGDGEPTYEEHRSDIRAEILWTVIPLLIVAWIGFISFDGFQAMNEEPEEPAAEIQMKGFQWFWQAQYSEEVSLSQQPGEGGSLEGEKAFVIPAGEPVVFNVTSGDVWHSFWVPELGVKMDAEPGGSNRVTVTAPVGEYLIQCAEMCGNPGHAYMNAKLHAVPQEDYQQWIQEKERQAQLGGQTVQVNITQEGLEPGELEAVAGVPTELVVANQVDETRSLTVEGVDDADTGDIEPGTSASMQATLEPGNYTLDSQGDQATLTAREVETVSVELDEWEIRSDRTEFEAGESYLLEVTNVGNSVHNLYIGQPEEEAGEDNVLANTDNLNAGESTTLLFEPTEDQTGDYSWWCDIAGHYAQGMVDDISVVE